MSGDKYTEKVPETRAPENYVAGIDKAFG